MTTIDMKLLSKDLLQEFGFSENLEKMQGGIEVMSKGNVNIVIKEGNFYYSNLGIDYPIRDLAALRKFYKEIKNQDLKPV